MANEFWTIDIGESAIKAVKMRRQGVGLMIVDFDRVEYSKLLSEAKEEKEGLIIEALTKLKQEHEIRPKEALAVSLSGQGSFSRFVSMLPVAEKNLPGMIQFEAARVIPFDMSEVRWTYQVMNPNPGPGEEIEVGIFAIKKDAVENFAGLFAKCGLVPDLIQFAPLAFYNFAKYAKADAANVLLDVGAESTSLLIIDEDKFWIRNSFIAGNEITKALKEKLQMSLTDAEDLKRKASESKQADRILNVIRPVLKNLVAEIQRSIGFYKSQSKTVKIERFLVSGNAFKMTGLLEFLRENLQYEIEQMDVPGPILFSSEVDTGRFRSDLGGYMVALGLGVQMAGLARMNTDISIEEDVTDKILKTTYPLGIAAAAIAIVFMAIGFIYRSTAVTGVDPKPIHQLLDRGNQQRTDYEAAMNVGGIMTKIKSLETVGTGIVPGRSRWYWYEIVGKVYDAFPKPQDKDGKARDEEAIRLNKIEIVEVERLGDVDSAPEENPQIRLEVRVKQRADEHQTAITEKIDNRLSSKLREIKVEVTEKNGQKGERYLLNQIQTRPLDTTILETETFHGLKLEERFVNFEITMRVGAFKKKDAGN